MPVELAGIAVAGDVAAWAALGFASDTDGRIGLANGAIVVGADLPALLISGPAAAPGEDVGWGVADVDGVPVLDGAVVDVAEHPNGAFELDHVVVMTDSLERTSAAIADVLGLELRRLRETDTVRQGFHRFPDRGGSRGCIVEVVENARVDAPTLWGVVVNVHDLDAAAAAAEGAIGAPKPAVQPGRRIATVRSSAGLSLPVALMTP